ncbi:two-component system sensor histidine kinase AdeS [Pseudorhizobium tarimense]|uniref:histidine kinase n=1 Tax=Pseudorhizobium tarimense TaxID=1079109 RepID=A0ABV2H310_9HYPH|nr:HAMP domain-containing sensor histidine kinase [Pseudorhizobium tarimense]MCJ8518083.1 ATP-binding protein [Pseudorhizobium tarimense]
MARRPSLAFLTVAAVSVTQFVTIALLYFFVEWYVDRAETVSVDHLPADAKRAWNDLNAGLVPDPDALAALAVVFPSLEEVSEVAPIAAILGFGAASILLSSLIGVFFAFRIAAPLSRFTAAAEKIRGGDFLVDVEPSATREIEALASTINSMASELSSLERRLKFNTRAVAHELRTPLTVLQGNLQGMSDGVIEPTHDRIRALYAQTQGMARLVEQLNTLSLVGTASFMAPLTDTDLASQVTDTVDLFKASAGNGLTCRTFLQPAPAAIDPVRFRQALLALLDNARRYAGGHGPIDVRTGTDEAGRSFISVEDRGPGMPPDVLQSSFDMFWRSEATNARGANGTGLGLTVVKAIAEAHGAAFSVKSRTGGGACATITFPAGAQS